MKFCVQCVNFRSPYCASVMAGVSPVDGTSLHVLASDCRANEKKCGPRAFWFEAKVEKSLTMIDPLSDRRKDEV